MTMTRLSLALLLSLALAPACVGPNPDYVPTPPPDLAPGRPQAVTVQVPLLPPLPPVALRGTWTGRELLTRPTPASCQDQEQSTVLVYSVPLDRADSSEVWADPAIKLSFMGGTPASWPGCTEYTGIELLYWTDQVTTPARLPGDRFLVPPGGALFLGVRLRGASSATIGGVGGSLVYVR